MSFQFLITLNQEDFMNFKSLVKAAALTATFSGALFAQGTVQTWVDHHPAQGCKPFGSTPPGVEIAYHHVSDDIAFGDSAVWDESDGLPIYLDKDIKVYGTLTVKPGCWIYGGTYSIPSYAQDSAQSASYNAWNYGSSLMIMEHGKAHLVGTKDSTIVMTGFGDDYRDILSFGPGVKGSWGGLIIKGLAPVSNAPYGGVYPLMEGIAGYEPDSIQRFGHGVDVNDNSGEYSYLSIRHGGQGRTTNSEINGISLYGVGAGTTMNHIEVMSNYDDAIEFFGGTVNLKYVCNSFCDDDQFDIDMDYAGKIQYALGVELNWMGNRGGEWDGLKNYDDPNKSAGPTICNMTLISCGKYSTNNKNDQNYGAMYLMQLADSLKGDYRNIIALDGTQYAFWMRNHDLKTPGHPGQAPMGPNGPKFTGLMVYNTNPAINNNSAVWSQLVTDDNGQAATTVAWLNNAANKCFCNADPQLRGVSREFNFAALDPRLCAQSPALTPAVYIANPNDGFFDQTAYAGAFGTSDLWCDGWTKLSQAGCLTKNLSTFPENAILPSNANFDIAYTINDPSAVPTNAVVTLDGNDISSIVLPIFIANNGQLACGGTWLKIPSIPASALASGTYNYLGLHTLITSISTADGRTLTGTSRFKIAN
jgi:hypothetical protein